MSVGFRLESEKRLNDRRNVNSENFPNSPLKQQKQSCSYNEYDHSQDSYHTPGAQVCFKVGRDKVEVLEQH